MNSFYAQFLFNKKYCLIRASENEDLHAGKRVSVICAAESGDLPMEFRWLKNDAPFKSNSGESGYSITVKQNDDFSSVLTIHNLSAIHSGKYSCVVSNSAATVRYTTSLQVNGTKYFSSQLVELEPFDLAWSFSHILSCSKF